MATVEWRNLFPLAQVFHELKVGSDQSPLVIKCKVPLKKVPFSFKFESMWTTHLECKDVSGKEWAEEVRGSDAFGLVQRLKRCKEALIRWSKKTFGKDKLRLSFLQGKIKEILDKVFTPASFEKEKGICERG